jgi:hypothetical protein
MCDSTSPLSTEVANFTEDTRFLFLLLLLRALHIAVTVPQIVCFSAYRLPCFASSFQVHFFLVWLLAVHPVCGRLHSRDCRNVIRFLFYTIHTAEVFLRLRGMLWSGSFLGTIVQLSCCFTCFSLRSGVASVSLVWLRPSSIDLFIAFGSDIVCLLVV